MKKKRLSPILPALMLSSLIAGAPALAESRYVTDDLEVTLRQGESTGHRIISMLKSGTQVEVLSTNKATGYSKVRAPNGKEGFVLSRLLMDEPIPREQLAALKQRLETMETEPARLSAELDSIREQYNALETEHTHTLEAKSMLEQELAGIRQTAANAINISNERTDLRKQVAELSRHVADLEQENRELKNDMAQDWFLVGGGVLAGGLVLGLILPNLRLRRRKTSWDTL